MVTSWILFSMFLPLILDYHFSVNGFTPLGCESLIDLTIIIDASESIIEDDPYGKPLHNWKRVVSLVKGVVGDLPISGEDSTRTKVQILKYSDKPELLMHLNQFKTSYDVINHLEANLVHSGGNTDTSQALELARIYVNDPSYGNRPQARNIVVLITDGISTINVQSTQQKAEDLKRTGAEVYTVALEEDVDEAQLNTLASYPPGKYSLRRDFYNDDARVQQLLLYRMCNLQDPTPAPPKCDIKIDLALVIDNSGSITDKNVRNETNHTIVDNYDTLKNFLKSMVDILDVGEFATRVGAVRFSHVAVREFHFDEHYEREELKGAIDNMHFTGSTTNTSGALRLARWDLYNENHGDRPDQNDVVLLITDGESNVDANLTIREAELLKNQGARIYVVGVTNQINETELKAIASDPDSDHYFNSTSIANLEYIRNALLKHVCHESGGGGSGGAQAAAGKSQRQKRSLQCSDSSCSSAEGDSSGGGLVSFTRERSLGYLKHLLHSVSNYLGIMS